MVPWERSFVVEEKHTWVRCRGIPLRVWSRDYFEKKAYLVGSLVNVDEATIGKKEMEFVRLCIRLLVGGEAKMEKLLNINGV